jgi:hypothetical protein
MLMRRARSAGGWFCGSWMVSGLRSFSVAIPWLFGRARLARSAKPRG